MRPSCTIEEARLLAGELFGVEGDVKQLASYSDQNFLVGGDYVLKIANSDEPEPVLRFQQTALQHVYRVDSALNTPQVIPLANGGMLGRWRESHVVWMVNFIPGHFISDLEMHHDRLLVGLGEYLGRLDAALESFEHEAMHRDLQWDLKQSGRLKDFLTYIDDVERRELVAHFLGRFHSLVVPRFPELRSSVIHNDANDNNILVHPEGDRVKSIIDFGDMVHTYTVCELAIAIAYMILGKDDMLGALGSVVKGYHRAYPLEPAEVEVLFDLVCMRLCTSVCMSARERRKEPENEYLAVSEAPAWNALHQLVGMDAKSVSTMIREITS